MVHNPILAFFSSSSGKLLRKATQGSKEATGSGQMENDEEGEGGSGSCDGDEDDSASSRGSSDGEGTSERTATIPVLN